MRSYSRESVLWILVAALIGVVAALVFVQLRSGAAGAGAPQYRMIAITASELNFGEGRTWQQGSHDEAYKVCINYPDGREEWIEMLYDADGHKALLHIPHDPTEFARRVAATSPQTVVDDYLAGATSAIPANLPRESYEVH